MYFQEKTRKNKIKEVNDRFSFHSNKSQQKTRKNNAVYMIKKFEIIAKKAKKERLNEKYSEIKKNAEYKSRRHAMD